MTEKKKHREPYLEHAAKSRKAHDAEMKKVERSYARWGWLCKWIGHKRGQGFSMETGPTETKFCTRCGKKL